MTLTLTLIMTLTWTYTVNKTVVLLQDAANQVENAMTAASDCGHQIVAQYLICML